MTKIEKNIRAAFKVERNASVKGRWVLCFRGRSIVEQSSNRGFKPWIEQRVRWELRDVRKAARILRDVGFKIIPPSKA